MITVLVADDEALVREGLRTMINLEPDMQVIAEAGDGAAAVEAARQAGPDVALLDVRMPVVDGLDATERILALEQPPKVIVLTTFDRNEYVYRAMKAGASAFLLKDLRRGELTSAIRAVDQGDRLVSPTSTRRIIEEFCHQPLGSTRDRQRLSLLTPRELDVLRLMARGLSNAEIADTLVLAETTVKTHVARVLTKLDLRDRVQAVVFSYENGLVRPGARD